MARVALCAIGAVWRVFGFMLLQMEQTCLLAITAINYGGDYIHTILYPSLYNLFPTTYKKGMILP